MRATSITPPVLTIVYISLFKAIKLEAGSYRTFQGLISLQACKLKLGQNKQNIL